MKLPQLKTPLLTGDSVNHKRAELKAYFRNTWETYESLFSLINQSHAYYLRAEPLRHPLIFYFGHTAVFYINKLILGKYIDCRLNKRLEAICAVGVDEMSWDDLDSEHYAWPSVNEVRDYRQQVATLIEQLIDDMSLALPITQHSLAWIILMGCEHERIHLETSSVIMRMLPLKYLTPTDAWPTCPFSGAAPDNQLLPVIGKTQVLGKKTDDTTYGWDNEYGQQVLDVADFKASQYLVSNAEFLTFVEAGGYQSPQYWTEEGQRWLAYKQAKMPSFWLKRDGQYRQRNLLNEMPLPMNWPVEVNYLEAKAFCQWLAEQTGKQLRLPTEAEWYCLRDLLPTDLVDWHKAPGNVNLEYFASSCPVDRFATDNFFDVVGNVWQWTESAIDGFTGFSVHPLYDDFSTPTFDGRHNVFKGGSWISTGNEAIKSSRYAFRRHFVQHAGFRYLESSVEQMPVTEINRYETNVDVCQQLHCHYRNLNSAGYFKALAKLIKNTVKQQQLASDKLLDLGCSVGRLSFELSSAFTLIEGVDFSARYIQHAVKLQTATTVRYVIENEGDIVEFVELDMTELDCATGDNIVFSQGDAGNLKPVFAGYDVVVLQQVLEQSYHPALILQAIHQRINPSGLLFVVSDYHFNETITAKDKWLGGVKLNGENVTGFAGLSTLLKPHFSLLAEHELTKQVCINHRLSQQSLLHVTIWQRV